ncbi:hypothetical protein BC628DRAFT_602994 [Trametes gibbosa]|nr:hypothetical protein BC628DRAFT_602994 [Trametes gibbosa]
MHPPANFSILHPTPGSTAGPRPSSRQQDRAEPARSPPQGQRLLCPTSPPSHAEHRAPDVTEHHHQEAERTYQCGLAEPISSALRRSRSQAGVLGTRSPKCSERG